MHEQSKISNGVSELLKGNDNKAVVAVLAHPDDVAFTQAATLWEMANILGIHTSILLMTDGDFEGHRAGKQRVFEQYAENEIVGLRGLRRARLPDGGIRSAMIPHAVDWISEQILRAHAEGRECGTILTFGPEGFTGHDDHRATNQAVRKAAKNLMKSGQFTGNIWQISMSEGERKMWPPNYFIPIPPADTNGCVCVDIHGESLRRKIDALKAHRSQRNNGGDRQIDIVHANPREYWRLWHPYTGDTVASGNVYVQNGNV